MNNQKKQYFKYRPQEELNNIIKELRNSSNEIQDQLEREIQNNKINELEEFFKDKGGKRSSIKKNQKNYENQDLSGLNLSKKIFTENTFTNCKLIGADLRESKLIKANISECDLTLVDLRNSKLIKAKILKCDLTLTDLKRADLSEATLHKTNTLCRVHFKNAIYTNYNLDIDNDNCLKGIFGLNNYKGTFGLEDGEKEIMKEKKMEPISYILNLICCPCIICTICLADEPY